MACAEARKLMWSKLRNYYGDVEEESDDFDDLDVEDEFENGFELGEVDTSIAMVIQVDGRGFKQTDPLHFDNLVLFMYCCRQKCYLSRFNHHGNALKGGELALYDDPELNNYWLFRIFATQAVEQYNNLRGEGFKLKLLNLIKVIAVDSCGFYYLTFTAQDETTGTIERYQAAVLERIVESDPENVSCTLGLFRRDNDDKPLAIISVIGGEAEYTHRVRLVEGLVTQNSVLANLSECGLM